MWYYIRNFWKKAFALFFLTFILWDFHFLNDFVTNGKMAYFGGILPGEPVSLTGLLHWAFLHGSFEHIMSNTVGLLIFGGVLLLRDKISTFFILTVLLAVSTGIMVWVFGHPGIHMGFSGVLFGYFSYVLTRGFFNKDPWSILIAVAVAFFYGSMIWDILPGQPGVSWEAHLFGFINGIVFSYIINRRRRFKRQF